MRYFGTLFFSQGPYGWSEVYPLNAASPTAAATSLGTISTDRLKMMVNDCSLIGARLSDTDIKNDSYPTGIIVPQQGSYAVSGVTQTYNPQIALRQLFLGGSTVRGSRWLRALPQNQVNSAGGLAKTSDWNTLLGQLISDIISDVSIATKIKGAVAPPFYVFTAVTSIGDDKLEKRNIGRPFGAPRGRRLIA